MVKNYITLSDLIVLTCSIFSSFSERFAPIGDLLLNVRTFVFGADISISELLDELSPHYFRIALHKSSDIRPISVNTASRGRVVSTPASFSGSRGFESLIGHRRS
jgi:hypothetical protein